MTLTRDPEFTAFFNGDWQRMLEAVNVPGMDGASWDRKAAWLLFKYGLPVDDSMRTFGYEEDPEFNWQGKPLERPGPRLADLGLPMVTYDTHSGFAPVGSEDGVNHSDDADCQPIPGGVRLDFDSSKW